LNSIAIKINIYQRELKEFWQGNVDRSPDLSLEQWWAYLTACASNKPVFITGNAGTGKSHLLKFIRVNSKFSENLVICAPTGMAAVNVQGATLHRIFGLAVNQGVLKPSTPGSLYGGFRPAQSKTLIRALELLVIDEISMVRADVLDTIDRILRLHRENDKPFGGVKVIVFGDLLQLPPVEDQSWLADIYVHQKYGGNPFFIASEAFQKAEFLKIELSEIRRQVDQHFIEILNRVRTADIQDGDLEWLNARSLRPTSDQPLRIFTMNKSVRFFNLDRLKQLNSQVYVFKAGMSGKYSDTSEEILPTQFEARPDLDLSMVELKDKDPADRTLLLSVGARVMFLRNEQGLLWVNGTLGTVEKVEPMAIFVRIDGTEKLARVEREFWSIFTWKPRDRVNTDGTVSKILQREEIGRFVQFPLRLAWAATVHKIQGQTFERVAVDLSDGTFTAGQAYVALSRVKSPDGLTILNPIKRSDIIAIPKTIQNYLATPSIKFVPGKLEEVARDYERRKALEREAEMKKQSELERLVKSAKETLENKVLETGLHECILSRLYFNEELEKREPSRLRRFVDEVVKDQKSYEIVIRHISEIEVDDFFRKISSLSQSSVNQAIDVVLNTDEYRPYKQISGLDLKSIAQNSPAKFANLCWEHF
jgi:ATP-dependent DNA helicase PIF1